MKKNSTNSPRASQNLQPAEVVAGDQAAVLMNSWESGMPPFLRLIVYRSLCRAAELVNVPVPQLHSSEVGVDSGAELTALFLRTGNLSADDVVRADLTVGEIPANPDYSEGAEEGEVIDPQELFRELQYNEINYNYLFPLLVFARHAGSDPSEDAMMDDILLEVWSKTDAAGMEFASAKDRAAMLPRPNKA